MAYKCYYHVPPGECLRASSMIIQQWFMLSDNKQLSEPILTQVPVAIRHHYAAMRLSEIFGHLFPPYTDYFPTRPELRTMIYTIFHNS